MGMLRRYDAGCRSRRAPGSTGAVQVRERLRRARAPVRSAIFAVALAVLSADGTAEGGPRWNGPYIGLGAGYGLFNSDARYTSAAGASLYVDDGSAGAGLLVTV